MGILIYILAFIALIISTMLFAFCIAYTLVWFADFIMDRFNL